MKAIFILFVAFFTLSVTATKAQNIRQTRTIMSLEDSYNQHDNMKALNLAEQRALKMDKITDRDFASAYKIPDAKWAKGADVYDGPEGKIMTLIYIMPDHASTEYLVSYDPQGNIKDCVSLGGIHAYAGGRSETSIEGNMVTNTIEDEGTFVKRYMITPDLRFVEPQ